VRALRNKAAISALGLLNAWAERMTTPTAHRIWHHPGKASAMDERHEQDVRRETLDSLTPIQVERAAEADDAESAGAAGTGQRFLGLLGAIGLCAVTGFLALGGIESRDPRRSAITAVRELHEQQVDGFLRCALPGQSRPQTATSAALLAALHESSEQLGKDYARVLQRCAIKLHALDDALQTLSAPADVDDQLSALRGAGKHLRQVVSDYVAYLRDPGVAYDGGQALPQVEKIAVAFTVYERRDEQLETVLRETP
jgi:hypothetical protein